MNAAEQRKGAGFNRATSKQDYQTPADFIHAVNRRFGELTWDLAAHSENTQCENYFSKEQDSFRQNWSILPGNLWLNPEFRNIDPWAEKCREESLRGARILFLTPANIGANWFHFNIHRHALVLALNGRLSFDGINPYPKDCILSCFGWGCGFDVWDWRAK